MSENTSVNCIINGLLKESKYKIYKIGTLIIQVWELKLEWVEPILRVQVA